MAFVRLVVEADARPAKRLFVSGDAIVAEPLLPPVIARVDQVQIGHVGRLELAAQLALLGGDAFRARHRRELGFEQFDAFETRPIARPCADADVGITGLDVDEVVAGRHADREFRMSHLERAQPPCQPGVCKGVRGGDGEEALVLLPLGGERRLDGIECLAKRRQQTVAERRQRARPRSRTNSGAPSRSSRAFT